MLAGARCSSRSPFRRQRAGIGDAPLDPLFELALCSEAVGVDPDPTPHLTSAHLERLGMRSGEKRLGFPRVDTHHQTAPAAGRDRHVATDEEGETSEHRLLGDLGVVGDQLTDPVGEMLVVSHPTIIAHRESGTPFSRCIGGRAASRSSPPRRGSPALELLGVTP